MAKQSETIVTFIDDLDGGKADHTVAFAVDGASYEIDLSKKNAAAFAKALRPYVDSARKVRATRARRRVRPAATSTNGPTAEIRSWAKANGYDISDRGRIPAAVVDAYNSAG